MNPEQEFINMYIEKLMNEVIETTKIRIMNETKVQYLENLNKQFLERIQELEKAAESEFVSKTPPSKRKGVNTSDF